MAIIANSEPWFQKRLRPSADVLAHAGITANQVTLVTMSLSLAAGIAVLLHLDSPGMLGLIPGALLIRLVGHHIEDLLAEEHGMKTPLGGILDELADVFCDAALYLPLAWIAGISSGLVVLSVFLGFMTEMAGVTAVSVGATRRKDGPVSKKSLGIAFAGIAMVLATGTAPGAWLDVTLALLCIALLLTVFKRIHGALREV